MSADFEDWTQGVTVVSGSGPLADDFPDWTTAIAVDPTTGGVIQEITSTGGTVTITNPTGPITNLEASGSGLPNPLNFTGTGVDLRVNDGTPTIVSTLQMTGTTPGLEIDCVDEILIKSEQSVLILEAPNDAVAITADTTGLGHITLDASFIDVGNGPSYTHIGFYGVGAAVARQTITGSRGGNAALASLLTALNNLGLIANSTTP